MKNVRLAVAALVFFPATWFAWSEGLRVTRPGRVGLSEERLGRIDAAMKRFIKQDQAAGAVALVARRGRVAYFEPFGLKDAESATPMTKDTIFQICSMSKPITSVAVMTLYEEGRFRLNDPVSKWIPELGGLEVGIDVENPETGEKIFKTVPADRDMTVRDLLRHTSGLTYGFAQDGSTVEQMYRDADLGSMDRTLNEFVSALAELPLKHHPGTVWEYSFSVDVLGRLIEVLSGQSFDVFLEERLFEPLGMADTGFYLPAEKVDRFAALYAMGEDGTIEPVERGDGLVWSFLEPPRLLSGGGGMVSTARDYYRFCQMLLNGGELNGARILSPKTVELMTQDHLRGISEDWIGHLQFGLGFSVEPASGVLGEIGSQGSYAWGGAANTRFWVDPREDLVGVFMVQTFGDSYDPSDMFKILVYQAIVK